MITVIIPTLNEEENIASVIKFAKQNSLVSEVLVVDDKSIDNTVRIAQDNDARVITSTKIGKGASMREGVMFSKNEIIVFLDADINPYPHFTIKLLTDPIIHSGAGFVKSSFNRNAGRVTELVAKPMLSIFFPDLLRFNQPLSGMIASKKSLLQQLDFRDDYGVDIGLLIDMHLIHVNISEVEIGYIENKSKPWQALGKMSKEVAQTIIIKASSSGNPHYNFEEFGVLSEIRSQMEFALNKQQETFNKLLIFDMDNTLLRGRFIDTCAERYGFKKQLMDIRSSETDSTIITKRIAKLLKGRTIDELIAIADGISIVDDTEKIITKLKKRGYVVGIISDSYDCITNHVRNKLRMDFSLSNELEFSKSVCTGEVKIPSLFVNNESSSCKHVLCKTNALQKLLEKYDIQKENSIAIGDSMNDLCMIKEAGLGIAFCSKDELLNHHADVIIRKPDFSALLNIAK
ncbi:MAG TPA: HAD-IB family phosphatase [Bacteroidia bacterium]|nr:HAD-IB family phosphatase [Bacteroidia bacterium]HOZ90449.1 HAD-IB family phosphatase [Bacteroidia bacterium]HQW17419.1 HAD-IB family phosphatase [Bacteroidia bacterium]HQW48549.1 HAD-IB family phosphatase [Bacteroidia bacterium]HQX69015.1 HAD-IB family phosphatase [Bacteroidia bacterium]